MHTVNPTHVFFAASERFVCTECSDYDMELFVNATSSDVFAQTSFWTLLEPPKEPLKNIDDVKPKSDRSAKLTCASFELDFSKRWGSTRWQGSRRVRGFGMVLSGDIVSIVQVTFWRLTLLTPGF